MIQDSRTQLAVLHELGRDGRVDETDIGVEVHDGIVTLTGTVDSYVKRLAAQEAAHRVPGVRDVANDVEVKIPGGLRKTDTEIAHSVREALEAATHVPDWRIRTTVTRGRVTLEGRVDTWQEREAAERAIHLLAGVVGVANLIDAVSPILIARSLSPGAGTGAFDPVDLGAENEA